MGMVCWRVVKDSAAVVHLLHNPLALSCDLLKDNKFEIYLSNIFVVQDSGSGPNRSPDLRKLLTIPRRFFILHRIITDQEIESQLNEVADDWVGMLVSQRLTIPSEVFLDRRSLLNAC